MTKETTDRHIVIVGGGTTGWMVAALLSQGFPREGERTIAVTVVESEEVPPIGVGEATIQSMRSFLDGAGVGEAAFMADCDATLKHGILFQDWLTAPSDGAPHRYFHPFEIAPPLAPEPIELHWLNARMRGGSDARFDQWAGVQGNLAAGNRSPKTLQDEPYQSVIGYGYHFDANKVAHHLKSLCLKRGVTHVIDHVTDVRLHQDGGIASIALRSGDVIEGDLFVDCTGFARVLHRELSPDFVDYTGSLFVDRAVTIRLPRPDDGYAPRPYTTASARSAGWTFEIDLAERQGLGLVYSSAHQSDEEAELELRAAFDLEDADLPTRRISFQSGRVETPWTANCIAMGLSYGFLEPLESTGLYFSELGARLLMDFLHFSRTNDPRKSAFNGLLNQSFDHSTDFIVLHYILSKRDDTPFWRDVASKTQISDRLRDLLALWETCPPTDASFAGGGLPFSARSHSHILYGMEHLPAELPEPIRHVSTQTSEAAYQALRRTQSEALNALPRHVDFLKKLTAAFT